MSEQRTDTVFDRLKEMRFHIAGEHAQEFKDLEGITKKHFNIDNRTLHLMLASIAASKNRFYPPFHKRKGLPVGGSGPFNDKTVYQHSAQAVFTDNRTKSIVLTIAFTYYNKYLKKNNDSYIETFEELYYLKNTTQNWTQITYPLDFAATEGLVILKEEGFDIKNDGPDLTLHFIDNFF
jgi:hypothetical protein